MDSSSLEWLYHDPAESGHTSAQGSGDLLALPRREGMRLHRVLASSAERVCGLQRERAGVAVGSMNHGREGGRLLRIEAGALVGTKEGNSRAAHRPAKLRIGPAPSKSHQQRIHCSRLRVEKTVSIPAVFRGFAQL